MTTGRRGIPRVWSVAWLWLACGACGVGTPPEEGSDGAPSGEAPRNGILISLDTLRADHLSCYGYPRPTSPRIDALAARGALFEHAIAESPWTLPSHASLLTGLFPTSHGAVRPSRRLKDGTPTLAGVLAEAGYATIGLTEGGYLARDYGLHQGFGVYSENRPDLETTLATARDLLAQLDGSQPWFLFLHTYDVHCPYEAPQPFVDALATDDEQWVRTEGACGKDFNGMDLQPGQVRTLRNRYDAGIRSVDELLGSFLEELDTRGLLQGTIVMITSDHGEELFEHGRIGHERTLHREVLRVPWIVLGPGVPPSRLTLPVGLTDVAPTFLDLLGIDAPTVMEGRSLAAILRGAPTPSHLAARPRVSSLAWKADLFSVWSPTHQLIVDTQGETSSLVEWDAGGNEVDAGEGSSAVESTLRSVLELHLQRRARGASAALEGLEAEQRERLRALGYGDGD